MERCYENAYYNITR